LFFSSFDETVTELGLEAEGLTETVLHLNWGFICFDVLGFLGFLVVCFVFSPLKRQQQNFFQTPTPGLEDEGLTPKLLRLKLYCI
jgi:hypothetical protein